MDNNILIEEAKLYVNSDMTVSETAKKLGISKRTFQLHLKRIKEIDLELYNLVLNKKESNIMVGRVKGGKIGKSHPRYSSEEAKKMAMDIINLELTYEQASEKFGIPKSTIYEMVHSDYIPVNVKGLLDAVAASNKKGILVSELNERKGK